MTSERKAEIARHRDLRLAATLVGVTILLVFALWGLGDLYRRATEDQSWAEGRCADVGPEHPTGSADWYRCIDRELGKNVVEMIWPQMVGAAAGLGVFILAARCRSSAHRTANGKRRKKAKQSKPVDERGRYSNPAFRSSIRRLHGRLSE